MQYHFEYTRSALKELRSLNKAIARRILKKLRDIRLSEDPLILAKPLKGLYDGYFRYRIGDYRVIFTKNEQGTIIILSIIKIGHRKDIYRI